MTTQARFHVNRLCLPNSFLCDINTASALLSSRQYVSDTLCSNIQAMGNQKWVSGFEIVRRSGCALSSTVREETEIWVHPHHGHSMDKSAWLNKVSKTFLRIPLNVFVSLHLLWDFFLTSNLYKTTKKYHCVFTQTVTIWCVFTWFIISAHTQIQSVTSQQWSPKFLDDKCWLPKADLKSFRQFMTYSTNPRKAFVLGWENIYSHRLNSKQN